MQTRKWQNHRGEVALFAPGKWRQGQGCTKGQRTPRAVLKDRMGVFLLTHAHKWLHDQMSCPQFLALGTFLQQCHKFHGGRRTLQKTRVKVSCLSESTVAPNKNYHKLWETKEVLFPHLQCLSCQGRWGVRISLEPAQNHVLLHHSS